MSGLDDHEAPLQQEENEHAPDAGSLVSGGKGAFAKGGKGKGKGGKKGKGKGKAAPGGGKGKGKGKGKSGGGKGKSAGGKSNTRLPPMARSALAELTFPVGRIHSRMKSCVLRKQRIGGTAAVYLTAILEYLTAELLDLSSNACLSRRCKRITPRHILMAIRGDTELNELVTAHIARGGVYSTEKMNTALLQKGSKAHRDAVIEQRKKGGNKKSSSSSGKKKSSSSKKSGSSDKKKAKKSSSGSSSSGKKKKKKGHKKSGSPSASPKKKSVA